MASRTVFYEWRRAFRHSGRDGVLSKPRTWRWGRPSRVLPEKHGPSPGEGACAGHAGHAVLTE